MQNLVKIIFKDFENQAFVFELYFISRNLSKFSDTFYSASCRYSLDHFLTLKKSNVFKELPSNFHIFSDDSLLSSHKFNVNSNGS